MRSYEDAINYMAHEYAKCIKAEKCGAYDRHDIARKSDEHYGFMSAIAYMYDVGILQVVHDIDDAYQLHMDSELAQDEEN